MMPARTFYVGLLQRDHFIGRIEVKNALARVANYGVLPGTDFIVGLRPKHDLASHALVIKHLGDARAAEL